MINHVRTLFLNESAAHRPDLGDNGEEYIPTSFVQMVLPGYLSRLRNIFLGAGSDPLYQNYRLAQVMSVVHSNDVAREYALGLDSRYTYTPFGGSFIDFIDTTAVKDLAPMGMVIETVGYGHADDAQGRAGYSWRAQTEAGPELRLDSLWDAQSSSHPLTITDERSQLIMLENGLQVRLYVPTGSWATGAQWEIVSNTRPGTDLGVLLARADVAGAGTLTEVFLDVPASFKRLWADGPTLPDRLGGLFSAMAMKMNGVMNG